MAGKSTLSPEQNMAADPTLNIWVQANAGTGKTSVLVTRLLRILFRATPSDRDPAPKHKTPMGILCLTYTNAGAAEMRNRILASLRNWAYADDDTLRDLLGGISHHNPATDKDLESARAIFYKYIDDPGMLRVRTIHSFCEEILRRFPLEAGISPSWRLVTESDQKRLMAAAFQELINSDADDDVKTAFDRIIGRVSEYSLDKLLGVLTDQYRRMFQINNKINYKQQFIDTIDNYLKYSSGNADNLFCPAAVQNRMDIADRIANDPATTKTLAAAGGAINDFLKETISFDDYKKIYLTADGTRRKKLKDYMLTEQELVHDHNQYLIDQIIRRDTVALFHLSDAFTKKYAAIKMSRNALDFDDIILYTQRLFSDPSKMGWVLSQLDSNLSHILVDEAQDTSPEQWNILRTLAADFFTNGDGDNPRSLFVVGDTKQSIYSFQGANPDEFAATKNIMGRQIANDRRDISNVPLSQSFRSTSAILSSVDHFFNDVSIGCLTKFKNNSHKCFRMGDAGIVEIHPINKPTENGDSDDETDTISPENISESTKKNNVSERRRDYINEITDKIQDLLTNRTLESSGRPIAANDIMILVQKRTPFVAPLVAELKRRNIAVAGSDRIKLPGFPAIRDLLNVIRFCLNQHNDYALACVLKSPIFRLAEGDLFQVCHNRDKETLFNRVNQLYPNIYKELQQILSFATMQPYSFFMRLLNTNGRREKMIGALGNQIIDPLEEFLTICLSYERTQSGGLAEFIQWFLDGASEIKRDMETGGGVRIMTVHASKGLDANIVFLIDTVDNPKSKHEGVGRTIPLETPGESMDDAAFLWSPDGGDSVKFQAAAMARQNKQIEEYYRLLYVAMTRARDHLYIYGFGTTKNPPEIAWHTTLAQILPTHPDAVTDENGITRIAHPQTRIIIPHPTTTKADIPIKIIPKTPAEWSKNTKRDAGWDTDIRDDDETQQSIYLNLDDFFKKQLAQKYATDTGKAAHRYLQFIKMDNDSDELVQKIKSNPAIYEFFTPSARTEVPIAGTINKKFMSRRIDRLVIDTNTKTVKFMDYKSDNDKRDRREKYARQLKEYADLLALVHPDYKITGHILWTHDWTIEQIV